MCISVLGLSSSHSSSFVILFIHSGFSLYILVAIFSSKIVRFLWYQAVGMFSCQSHQIVDRIFFRCFGKSCFVCIVLPFVDISLIFFLSSALPGLFTQIVMLFFLVLPVPFYSRLFQCLSFLSFWLVFVVLLFAFPVEFPFPILTISSCFLRGSQFSYKLILQLHRLVHLTRLYYSSLCKVVYDSFYSFLS